MIFSRRAKIHESLDSWNPNDPQEFFCDIKSNGFAQNPGE